MANAKHQHIDSSGVFDCPLGSSCKLPSAGVVFDELVKAAQRVIATANKIPPEAGPEPQSIIALRKALAKAEGRRR